MIIFDRKSYLQFHTTTPKIDDIETIDYLKYNFQSLNSTGEKICVVNGVLFYFNDDGKVYLYCIIFKRYPVIKKKCISSFI